MSQISDLMAAAHENAKTKGFWNKPKKLPECFALWHSEISEALEEYRVHGMNPDKFIYIDERGKLQGIASECADVLIRVFDVCEGFSIPLEEALAKKMEYNRSREFRHGNKII